MDPAPFPDARRALLQSKLQYPSSPSHVIKRQRLLNRVNSAGQPPVILVVAPAGYGKTTLLQGWADQLQADKWKTAWLTLDEYDNSLLRFWAYLLAAIRLQAPSFHAKVELVFRSLSQPDDWSILNETINEIAQLPGQFCLFLDDFETIQAADILQSLTYFIKNLPENLCLVISGRTNPALPLARLRTHQRVLEISAEDLSFSQQEAQDYLSKVMNLNPSAVQLKNILEATHGWIAGLQIATVSIQARSALAATELGKLTEFDQRVFDYLAEEVLVDQPAAIQDFLADTSILRDFDSELCDMIRESQDAQSLLQQIVQANLFIERLNGPDARFRYHPLMAKTMRERLRQTNPQRFVDLHQHAVHWYLEHNFPDQAVDHALAIDNLQLAANILENSTLDTLVKLDRFNLIHWLGRLSDPIILERPILGIYFAVAAYLLGQPDKMRRKIYLVEEAISNRRDDQSQIDHFDHLQWHLTVLHAIELLLNGDVLTAVRSLEDCLHTPPAVTPFFLGLATHILAAGYTALETYDAALKTYDHSARTALRNGFINDFVHSRVSAAQVLKIQGLHTEAEGVILDTMGYLSEYENEQEGGMLGLRVNQMNLAIEHCDLSVGSQWEAVLYQRLLEVEKDNAMPEYCEMLALGLGKYYLAAGSISQAMLCMYKATAKMLAQPYLFEHPYQQALDLQAQIWAATGDILTNESHLKQHLHRFNPFAKPLEAELTAQARIDLAHGNLSQALITLTALEEQSRKKGHAERLIEVLILEASAYQQSGQISDALQKIEAACDLAMPQKIYYPFVREGIPIANLLSAGVQMGIFRQKEFIQQVLAHFPVTQTNSQTGPASLSAENMGLLSTREIEVLELLLKHKSAKEIAVLLSISLNTAKAHIKSVYRKMDIHSRKDLFKTSNTFERPVIYKDQTPNKSSSSQ
jgi:LuxR family maltose regulon positive regulatory protein